MLLGARCWVLDAGCWMPDAGMLVYSSSGLTSNSSSLSRSLLGSRTSDNNQNQRTLRAGAESIRARACPCRGNLLCNIQHTTYNIQHHQHHHQLLQPLPRTVLFHPFPFNSHFDSLDFIHFGSNSCSQYSASIITSIDLDLSAVLARRRHGRRSGNQAGSAEASKRTRYQPCSVPASLRPCVPE